MPSGNTDPPSIDARFQRLESNIDGLATTTSQNQASLKEELKQDLNGLRNAFDLRLNALADRIDSLELAQKNPLDDADLCVMISGLHETANDNLRQRVLQMFSRLEYEDIDIDEEVTLKACIRIPNIDGSTLVKVAVGSLTQKIKLLLAKRSLLQDQEYRGIRISPSRSRSDRLAEYNFKTILRLIPGIAHSYTVFDGKIIDNDPG